MNGTRGLIALGVLLCHATAAFWLKDWWGPFAYSAGIGLMAFFAFSGFLLYRPYVAARVDGRPEPRVRDYTRRRLLRILPAYWSALTLLAIWPGLPGVFSDHWYAYYGFLQIYKLEWMTGGLPQVWSLCIDASFYAVLPLYAVAMGRLWGRNRSLRLEAVGVVVLIVASFAIRLAVSGGLVSPWLSGTLPGFLGYFALGMGMAVLSVAMRAGAVPEPLAGRVRKVAGFGLLGAVGFYLVHATVFGVPGDLHTWELPLIGQTANPFANMLTEVTHKGTLFAFAACLMLPLVLGETRGAAFRLLTSPTLVGIGVVSYGLYLYHVPVLGEIEHYTLTNHIDFFGHPVLGTIACALSFSLPLAMASYRYFELPFLSRKERRLETRRPAPVPERAPA